MEDFLSWFYEHYIKTTLSSQSPDFGTACRADLLRSVLDRFYALRSFRLGLRTGLALARDLEDGPLTPPPPSEGGLP